MFPRLTGGRGGPDEVRERSTHQEKGFITKPNAEVEIFASNILYKHKGKTMLRQRVHIPLKLQTALQQWVA